jgi:hypothetical protein
MDWPDRDGRFSHLGDRRKNYKVTQDFAALDEQGTAIPLDKLDTVFVPGSIVQADAKLRLYVQTYPC